MSEEYDLRASEKNIGQLLPIIKDEKGRIVDGLHRRETNAKWRVEIRKEIKTDEDYWKARAHLNFSRRNAQEASEEKAEIIAALTEIYKKQGLTQRAIEEAVIQALDGALTRTYVLSVFHKKENKVEYDPQHFSAIQALEHDKFTVKRRYGDNFVERLKEEVAAEEKPKLEKQIKRELLKSPEFVREAIEKAPELAPTLPKSIIERAKKAVEPKEMTVKEGVIYTIGEYECPRCKKHYLIRCDGKHDWVE